MQPMQDSGAGKPEMHLLSSPLLVPLVLLVAAYTVHLYPDRGVVVLLLLGVLATFGPTSEPMVQLMVDTMERVALQSSRSPRLCRLAVEQMHAVLSDPFTQRCFTESCKLSMVEAMLDERLQAVMVSSMTKSMATATIAASQDEDLRNTLNTAMRNGVAEALADEALVGTFFTVLKEGLKDPKLHQALLKGAATAANPLKDMHNPWKDLQNPLKDLQNPLKDLAVPTLKPSNPLKAVQSTLKEAMVDAEAKLLANASGLTRDPPPIVHNAINSSPTIAPLQRSVLHDEEHAADSDFHDVCEVGKSW